MVGSNKEWLEFIEITNKGKTKVFLVKNKETKEMLGEIKWFVPFREYCYRFFSPNKEIVLAPSCMEQMAKFCRELMTKRKEK